MLSCSKGGTNIKQVPFKHMFTQNLLLLVLVRGQAAEFSDIALAFVGWNLLPSEVDNSSLLQGNTKDTPEQVVCPN